MVEQGSYSLYIVHVPGNRFFLQKEKKIRLSGEKIRLSGKKNKTFRGKYGKYLCELMDTERKEFLLRKKQKAQTIKRTFDI